MASSVWNSDFSLAKRSADGLEIPQLLPSRVQTSGSPRAWRVNSVSQRAGEQERPLTKASRAPEGSLLWPHSTNSGFEGQIMAR